MPTRPRDLLPGGRCARDARRCRRPACRDHPVVRTAASPVSRLERSKPTRPADRPRVRTGRPGCWRSSPRAADGATIEVPAGLYRGPFTIERAVRLHAAGPAHLRGDGRTHTVEIRAADVVLDGFEISGSGLDLGRDHAAVHVSGARAVIVNNRIHDALHGCTSGRPTACASKATPSSARGPSSSRSIRSPLGARPPRASCARSISTRTAAATACTSGTRPAT